VEARISCEQPDPVWLCVKFNIAEPRFEVSKVIIIYMVKINTQNIFFLNCYMFCIISRI